jgi:hypothetical protein
MADIYDRAAALVVRQLRPRPAGKGAPCVLRVSVPGVRNPATGTTSPPTVTDYPTTGLRTRFAFKDVDGTRVLATDDKILMVPAPDMPTPKPGNVVIFDGKNHTVINADAADFAGVPIYYTVQGRAS